MARIAALGERSRIRAFALAGVVELAAATDDEVVAAWRSLASDVAVLVLTPEAQRALAGRIDERRDVLVTVLP